MRMKRVLVTGAGGFVGARIMAQLGGQLELVAAPAGPVLSRRVVEELPIPMDPACRTALTVVVFAPLSSVTTVFSQELGCDTNVAALAGSISMPISVCAFVALLIFLA